MFTAHLNAVGRAFKMRHDFLLTAVRSSLSLKYL